MPTCLRVILLLLFGVTFSTVYAQQHLQMHTPVYENSYCEDYIYNAHVFYWAVLPLLVKHLAVKTVNLAPISLKTSRGEGSKQDLAVLATETQQAREDNWHEYQEFFIENKGYMGTFVYQLPKNYRVEDIATLNLITNYKGASKAEQVWQWKIYNNKDQQWQLLGDNSYAADWQWTHLEFPISGSPSEFVNPQGKFKIRYIAIGQHDNDVSTLDLLRLQIQLKNTQSSQYFNAIK
jgi:hypothetical protein